ncbi:MAG: hypothetical protein WC395_00845 [Bacteroidales bacterium]|jgi:hypothetical protein
MKKTVELLAPAKDLMCAIEAVNHGADAVYMGAARFGARSSAGNTIEDVGKAVRYAHRYGASVYITLNTLLYDHDFQMPLLFRISGCCTSESNTFCLRFLYMPVHKWTMPLWKKSFSLKKKVLTGEIARIIAVCLTIWKMLRGTC